ncbi:MAG: hypothetical protein AMQ22_02243 [Candidatus Methanofastidiosum methylothiophilum]|uniref:Uncharacterized protein n=1 Tax=Candidatus Methanofastidiosum methylothiophilum TaxID=1705564 RepID=A0A150IJ82_9EURY|nr:MAG: hypothetical protein AMQ22_02243 [Candidatus Methanofastidiosum methylthiophilus]
MTKLKLSKTITSGYLGGVERTDYKVIEDKSTFCCLEFKNSILKTDLDTEDISIELDIHKGKVGIPKYDNSFTYIDYCPFCGTKIESDVINFTGKSLCPSKLRHKRYKLVPI